MKIAIFHNLPGGGGKRSLKEWMSVLSNTNELHLYGFADLTPDFCNVSSHATQIFALPTNPKVGKGIMGKFFSIIRSEYYGRILAKKINAESYDVAFILQCEVTNSPPLLRMLRHKCVYYCQEPLTRMLEPHYNQRSLRSPGRSFLKMVLTHILIWYDRFNAKYADLILCNSYFSKENIYRAYGRYPALAYLGINVDRFSILRGVSKDKKKFLSVGHLNSAKGHDFVIRALALVVPSLRPEVEIVYNLEDDSYKSYLQGLAAELDVDLILTKSPTDADLLIKYNSSYVLLCAPRLEPLGLSPLEAMACGTPVIGAAEGGIRETVVDCKTGLLVEREPAAMAMAIERVLTDEYLYLSLRSNCRQHVVTNWTWGKSADIINQHLVEAMV